MVDTFRAHRQFERVIGRYSRESQILSQHQEYDLVEDEVVATLVYDRDSRTVTIMYPGTLEG